jgi:formate dehydrogenase major subunit
VSRVCGCRPEEVIKVAELLCRNSGRERTSAIAYALGWTQHSTGAQMIRAAAIIQLLLGNVGRPGGGVLALRGHACIQGATDIPVPFDMLPGYLPQPRAVPGHATLAQCLANGKSYLARRGDVPSGLWQEDVARGAWSDMPTFAVSLLKAWYGEAATPENEYRYTWLPKIDEDLSEMSYFVKMHQGHIRGTFVMGQNPAAGGPSARLYRDALRRLDWLVVRDFRRVEDLHGRGVTNAYLYGDTPSKSYSELNSFYLLFDRPSVYGLPDNPFNPWLHMQGDYVRAIVSGLAAIAALLAVLLLLGN